MLPANILASRRWWKVGISSGMQNIPPELPSKLCLRQTVDRAVMFPVIGTTHGSAGGITKVTLCPYSRGKGFYFAIILKYGGMAVCTKKYQPIYGL